MALAGGRFYCYKTLGWIKFDSLSSSSYICVPFIAAQLLFIDTCWFFNSLQELDQVTISKNFMPFGGGTRQCAGAEYSKLVLSTFLHILVTDYR
jgi:hypothetical protein